LIFVDYPLWLHCWWATKWQIKAILKRTTGWPPEGCPALPAVLGPDKKWGELMPENVHEVKSYVDKNRKLKSPFDIIVERTSPGDDPEAAAEMVQPWVEAGVTWWIESMWGEKDPAVWKKRLRGGPPPS
jgi:hypothetical protein